MKYDPIIQEMQQQIHQLTQQVQTLQATLAAMKGEAPAPAAPLREIPPIAVPHRKNGKVTKPMLTACYKAAKEFNDRTHWNIRSLADRVAAKTGMNRNNAVMTILAAYALLNGELYKRTLSGDATAFFFECIHNEFGSGKLQLAIAATRKHIDYRRALHHNVDKLEQLCDRYQAQLAR